MPEGRSGRARDAPRSKHEAGSQQDGGRRRMFFALWPDAATRSAIVRATRPAVQLSGGAPIAKDRLHITVAFLGSIDAEEIERARQALPVAVGAFDLALETIGVWPQSRTLWLAGRDVPPALEELEERLWDALEARGFAREVRSYRPHLTLARRARAVDEVVEPVQWRVEDIVLAESLPVGGGVHYEVIERWAL